jgi:hypothetical protein
MSADTPVIDLGYRPQSYFWPITHDTHVIAAIKGERRRNAFDADRVTPLDAFYATPTLPDEDRRALGRLHPSFMGGEYLPDRRDTEVEIARISIDSTTSDVTSVYAKAGKDRIYPGRRRVLGRHALGDAHPQLEAAVVAWRADRLLPRGVAAAGGARGERARPGRGAGLHAAVIGGLSAVRGGGTGED